MSYEKTRRPTGGQDQKQQQQQNTFLIPTPSSTYSMSKDVVVLPTTITTTITGEHDATTTITTTLEEDDDHHHFDNHPPISSGGESSLFIEKTTTSEGTSSTQLNHVNHHHCSINNNNMMIKKNQQSHQECNAPHVTSSTQLNQEDACNIHNIPMSNKQHANIVNNPNNGKPIGGLSNKSVGGMNNLTCIHESNDASHVTSSILLQQQHASPTSLHQSSKPSTSSRSKSIKFQMENPSDPNYKSFTQKSNYKEISIEDMSKYFHLPQTQAAEMLGVSLSTLKRRFYSLGIGRWPSYENNNPSASNSTIAANAIHTSSFHNNTLQPPPSQPQPQPPQPQPPPPVSSLLSNNNNHVTSNVTSSSVSDNSIPNNNNNSVMSGDSGLHLLSSNALASSDDLPTLTPNKELSLRGGGSGGSGSGQGHNTTSRNNESNSSIASTPPPIPPLPRVFTHVHEYVRNSLSTPPPNEQPQRSRMHEESDESILKQYQQKTNGTIPQEIHIHHHHYHIYQHAPPQTTTTCEYYPTLPSSRQYQLPPPLLPPLPLPSSSSSHSFHPFDSYHLPPPYHSSDSTVAGVASRNFYQSSNSPNSSNPNIIVNPHSQHHQDERPKNQPVPAMQQIRKSPNREILHNSFMEQPNMENRSQSPESSETSHSDSNRRLSRSYLYHPYQKQGTLIPPHNHVHRPKTPEQPSSQHSRYASSYPQFYGESGANENYNHGISGSHHYEQPPQVYSSLHSDHYQNRPNWEEKDSSRKEFNAESSREQYQNYR